MHITVTRPGGIAGLRVQRSVDTAQRPDAPEWEYLNGRASRSASPVSPAPCTRWSCGSCGRDSR